MKKEVKLSFWDRLYLPAIIVGMGITIKHFFKTLFTKPSNRYTVEFPERKKILPEWYRGLHRLNTREDGSIKCVSCYCCATACPADAIFIEAEDIDDLDEGYPREKRPKQFIIDLHRCIFCGFCEEACPEDAIILTNEYEITHLTRDDGLITMEELVKTPKKKMD